MSNPEFLYPPIEVVATSPRLDMIKARLRSSGLQPYDHRNDAGQDDPILIDAASITGEQLVQIRRLIARKAARIVILLAEANAPILEDAITINGDAELASVPARIAVEFRKRDRLREVRLRAQTARELVGARVKCFSDEPASILYLGNGSSRFLALGAAMKTFGVSITAALTPLTAFDYLAQNNFSCVLVDIEESSDRTLEFLSEFHGDFQLSNVPVFTMIRGGSKRTEQQQYALANATEIIDSDPSIMKVAEDIAMMAEYHKAATPMSPEITNDSRVHDRMTGLFTEGYLKQHLENQLIDAEDYLLPITFLSLQLTSPADGNTGARKALPALAKFIEANIRQTDCAGRLNWTTIGVSLRNTGHNGATQLARRLQDKVGGDSLSALKLPDDVKCTLSWRAIERRAYHSATDLLVAATKGPQSRIIRAA